MLLANGRQLVNPHTQWTVKWGRTDSLTAGTMVSPD